MAKLIKQVRYTKDGTPKINCYHVNISKEILNKSGLKEDDDIIAIAKNKKIIIKKK